MRLSRLTLLLSITCACTTTLNGGSCEDVCSASAAGRGVGTSPRSDDDLIDKLSCFCPDISYGTGPQDAGTYPVDADADAGPLLRCEGPVLERYELDGATFVVADVCVSEAACQQSLEASSASCPAQ